MVLITAAFLFNILCAIVPCDPQNAHPTASPKLLSNEDNETSPQMKSFKRSDPNGYNSVYTTKPAEDPIVFTKSGALQGYFMTVVNGKRIYAFEGIPFAQPLTPAYRFRAAAPVLPWSGIRTAFHPRSLCLQVHIAKLARVTGNEDCLYMNIYSSNINSDAKLPVIIFIHGGSFMFGSGSEYGPSYILGQNKDLIFITINYRVGPLGFLSTGDSENPGNWGLKDQGLAIQWIYENIPSFGGDPTKITLMGQSAGAAAVHLHMMSNMTKGLLNNAVALSGSAFVHWAIHTQHQALKWSEKFGKVMRCPITKGTKDLMNCLRNKDPNFLTGNQLALFDFLMMPPVAFRPVVEPNLPGAFITQTPETLYSLGQVAKIPLLATTTKEEAEFTALTIDATGLFRLLLNHFEAASPTIMDYKLITTNHSGVTQRLAHFYMNGTQPKNANFRTFSDMGTDRYFTFGNRKTLRAHSKIAPTYSSIFSFKGKHGLVESVWGRNHVEYGTPHGDDLAYFFNSTLYWPSFKKSDPGLMISRLLVNLVTNFATTGEPLYTNENGTDMHIWDRVNPTQLTFLQIDREVKMIEEPFPERMKFWEDLNLDDRFPYDNV